MHKIVIKTAARILH